MSTTKPIMSLNSKPSSIIVLPSVSIVCTPSAVSKSKLPSSFTVRIIPCSSISSSTVSSSMSLPSSLVWANANTNEELIESSSEIELKL